MKKKNKKIITVIALIIMITSINTGIVMALDFDPDKYVPNQQIDQGKFLVKSNSVLGWIQFAGILVSVIALTIIGIKYLFGSVENKAEYKKTMLPYVLGCFLLMGTTIVIEIIENIAKV